MLRFTLNNAIEGVYVCPKEPKGWDSGTLSLIRSPLMHGINYTRTLSLQFLCGAGKEYIDKIYETQGIDAEITVLVEDSCDCIPRKSGGSYDAEAYTSGYQIGGVTYDCDWVEFFRGLLNLKDYNRTEQETDVTIIEQSLNQKLTSRLETNVDIFGTDTVGGETFTNIDTQSEITLHSKALLFSAEFVIDNIFEERTFDPGSDSLYLQIPLLLNASEGFDDLGVIAYPYLRGNVDSNSFGHIYHNTTGEAQDFKITIDVEGFIAVNGNGNIPSTALRATSLQLNVGVDFDSAVDFFIKPIFNVNYNNSFVNVPLDSTLTVNGVIPDGQKVFVSFVIANIPTDSATPFPWQVQTAFTKFNVTLENINILDSSQATGTMIYETFSRVLQGILDIEDPLRSSYYGRIGATPYEETANGDGAFTLALDGFRVRNYPLTGTNSRTPKFNFKTLFDTFNAIDDIGFGFEKLGSGYVGRIERKPFFYKNNKSLTLTKVPNVKISVAQDLYYNDINIGFDKWQANGINGLGEYCARSQYTNALKGIDNSLEKISPGIASAYLLEDTRRKSYSVSITTDTEYDTDLFIVATNRSVDEDGVPDMLDVAEKDENFSNIENVLHPPSVYNLRWSVARNLIRNIPTIAPSLVKNPGRLIKFTSGEGNYKTVTAETTETIGDYNHQDLSGEQSHAWDGVNIEEYPLYIPEYIEFDYPLKKSQFQILQDQPYDYIEVDTGKQVLYGYIEQIDYKPKSGLTTFKLKRKWL